MSSLNGRNIEPPLLDLPIDTADTGYYGGFSKQVAIPAKILISLFVIWAIAFPTIANDMLVHANEQIIETFAGWYVYLVAVTLVVAVLLTAIPRFGNLKIGLPDDEPEFSRFSWFAMMFGAGLGIGMLTYSTGEPLSHFANNPEIISGVVESVSAEAVRPAYVYSFLHWGFSPWGVYALVGLAIGYISYRRGLPLTIRSGLAPIFGRHLSGPLGHVIDIVAVVATVFGIAVTLSLGILQFIAGLHRVFGGDWLINDQQAASTLAIIMALLVIVGASTLSAISGVGRGIKWLSNTNLVLSFCLLFAFITAGSGLFGIMTLGVGMFDYIIALPRLLASLFSSDGSETGNALVQWQLDWTVFYWAWWIAFAPFVGMFIARVSRGRTLREYMLGVVLVPSLMCFVWLALVGGTAIDLELSGAAQGSIIGSALPDQLYATLAVMFDPAITTLLSVLVLILLLTYVITSADSAILIVNTINAAGEDHDNTRIHIIFWGVAIAMVVGSLLIAGGIDAIRTAMIIGALPFSVVVALMICAIVKAVVLDTIRVKQGVECTSEPIAVPMPEEIEAAANPIS